MSISKYIILNHFNLKVFQIQHVLSGTKGVKICVTERRKTFHLTFYFSPAMQGTLIQHLKEHILHGNMTSGDVIIYYTTVGLQP